MGFIDQWARIASVMPGLVNFLTHTFPFGFVAKTVAGIAPQRELPVFAPETFKSWFKRRGSHPGATRRVILWPDTFTNHFNPEIAQAAVEVLEAAGFEVSVPSENMCCGRPLYDFGFLEMAKQYLENILGQLAIEIYAGTPVVVLEPSCAATFRDELVNILPDHSLAKRLNTQTFLLSEFLEKHAPEFHPPRLNRKAVVHGHCHHKAIMKMDAEEKIMKKMGIRYEMPDSGCCGMAGAFGFEDKHYDVSIKCGERVLLPKVREAAKDTIVIADGFSCREQIKSSTDRRALHLAQVIKMAMDDSSPVDYPERQYIRQRSTLDTKPLLAAAGLTAGLAFLLWRLRD
jgi:Fe-S oxidoreductase